jgi:autophagy-related protein 11
MSLQIAVSHTGQRLNAEPVDFTSIDALKRWISSATQIPPEAQILLTPRGKHARLQALLTEVGALPKAVWLQANSLVI